MYWYTVSAAAHDHLCSRMDIVTHSPRMQYNMPNLRGRRAGCVIIMHIWRRRISIGHPTLCVHTYWGPEIRTKPYSIQVIHDNNSTKKAPTYIYTYIYLHNTDWYTDWYTHTKMVMGMRYSHRLKLKEINELKKSDRRVRRSGRISKCKLNKLYNLCVLNRSVVVRISPCDNCAVAPLRAAGATALTVAAQYSPHSSPPVQPSQ